MGLPLRLQGGAEVVPPTLEPGHLHLLVQFFGSAYGLGSLCLVVWVWGDFSGVPPSVLGFGPVF